MNYVLSRDNLAVFSVSTRVRLNWIAESHNFVKSLEKSNVETLDIIISNRYASSLFPYIKDGFSHDEVSRKCFRLFC